VGFTLTKAEENLLEFGDGVATIVVDHIQDCCEHVYADCAQLKDKIGQEFSSFVVEKVPGSGFRVGGEFVPCYDIQNGYYSSDLTLTATICGVETKIDLSDCTQTSDTD
jgi:hypothetical protein